MAWFLIIVAIILLWVVSLCKVLSSSTPKNAFLSNGEVDKKRNVLLVVAHPDDESMFFCPTLLYLTSKGHAVHLLCMSTEMYMARVCVRCPVASFQVQRSCSHFKIFDKLPMVEVICTGNADGKGNIRKEELYQACAALKVPLHQVKILDHPDLQDGFNKAWSRSLLAKIIEQEIVTQGIDLLITFDSYGVSGHQNHRDVHYGIRTVLSETSRRSIEAWELVSTSIIRKYSGPVDIWFSILCASCDPRQKMWCLINQNPRKSFFAMAQHESQWIWFRKLFVSFSSYTYLNTLRKMNF